MQSDTITRLLLAGVLVCLVVLIVQNLTEAPPPPASVAEPAAPPEEAGDGPVVRNRLGRKLTQADLVTMASAVANEALPTDMRVWAALQLEGVSHPEVSRTLIATLDAAAEELSIAALQALVGNPDPRVREAALRASRHEDEGVRAVARYVLESIGESAPGG